MDDRQKRDLLRHFIATLAYRTHRAVDDAPESFAEFSAGSEVRTPLEILRHMTYLVRYAEGRFGKMDEPEKVAWDAEIERFDTALGRLDAVLVGDAPLRGTVGGKRPVTFERLLQGPLTDAMTHAGQLAMLRRLAGSPVDGENFIAADIVAGKFTLR